MSTSEPRDPKIYTQPFSKKMNSIAVAVIIGMMVIGAPIIWTSNAKPLSPSSTIISIVVEGLVWVYLTAILFVFYKRTRLQEYLLSAHSFWLAGLVSSPIAYILSKVFDIFRNDIGTIPQTIIGISIGCTWLVLALIGEVISRRRKKLFYEETLREANLWCELHAMTIVDIALLKFPKEK